MKVRNLYVSQWYFILLNLTDMIICTNTYTLLFKINAMCCYCLCLTTSTLTIWCLMDRLILLPLRRCFGLQRQSMDQSLCLQLVIQELVHHAVSLDGRLLLKLRTHNDKLEMSLGVLRSSVLVTLINHIQMSGVQASQLLADRGC